MEGAGPSEASSWAGLCGRWARGAADKAAQSRGLRRPRGHAPCGRAAGRWGPAAARVRLPVPAGVCSGWGDPHYITFDGTYYTFLDNCTYVLVQQVVPVYGHFRVLITNYFCDAQDRLSCPQAIIVEYQQDRVVLTREPVRGVMTNEVGLRARAAPGGAGWRAAPDGRGRGVARGGATDAGLPPPRCV